MVFSVDSTDWVTVHKTPDLLQAEFLKNELGNQEIAAVIVNRKDTMYPIFGQANLYVERRNLEIARVILETFLTSND